MALVAGMLGQRVEAWAVDGYIERLAAVDLDGERHRFPRPWHRRLLLRRGPRARCRPRPRSRGAPTSRRGRAPRSAASPWRRARPWRAGDRAARAAPAARPARAARPGSPPRWRGIRPRRSGTRRARRLSSRGRGLAIPHSRRRARASGRCRSRLGSSTPRRAKPVATAVRSLPKGKRGAWTTIVRGRPHGSGGPTRSGRGGCGRC